MKIRITSYNVCYTKLLRGLIEIDIIRSTQTALEFDNDSTLPAIIDFVIKDNGVGFNEKNYDSFNFAHSIV